MTPLAQLILSEIARPAKRRRSGREAWHDPTDGMPLSKMFAGGDVHCFETSEVVDAMYDLRDKSLEMGQWSPSEKLSFLPAPQTWIEWRNQTPDGRNFRFGWLLQEASPRNIGDTVVSAIGAQVPSGATEWHEVPVRIIWQKITDSAKCADVKVGACPMGGMMTQEEAVGWAETSVPIINAFLAMINTPKIIGRTTHMPHAGLQRRLAAAHGMTGKFPLKAWTEIRLRVTPPRVDGSNQEIHLTGRKALHFCRAHLRVRLGRLELVSAHWRGDPALGIKQSRYKLTA